MKSWTIVGYAYRADNYCPECVLPAMGQETTSWDVEAWLNKLARQRDIVREDEATFDSDVFPKVVFADQAENDRCRACHGSLI